jgi:hypothetical protein
MSPILVTSSEPTELRRPVPVSNASDVPDTKDIAGSNSNQHLPGKTLLSGLYREAQTEGLSSGGTNSAVA